MVKIINVFGVFVMYTADNFFYPNKNLVVKTPAKYNYLLNNFTSPDTDFIPMKEISFLTHPPRKIYLIFILVTYYRQVLHYILDKSIIEAFVCKSTYKAFFPIFDSLKKLLNMAKNFQTTSNKPDLDESMHSNVKVICLQPRVTVTRVRYYKNTRSSNSCVSTSMLKKLNTLKKAAVACAPRKFNDIISKVRYI